MLMRLGALKAHDYPLVHQSSIDDKIILLDSDCADICITAVETTCLAVDTTF